MLNERSDFRDLIMEIISKQSEVRVGKKAKSNRFPFTLMLVVPDQKNFDNKGSEINIGYACVTHNWRFSSKLWFYVGASPCNSPEIRRRQCNLVTVEGREERQPLLCQEEMIGRSVPLPSPRGAPSASRCSYGRSAVNKDRGSSLYIWRRIRKEAILIYQPVQMTIECCGSGKHITLVTLVKMKMECVRHMIKNHEDAAAIYVLKHVFQFRFILMHLSTLLCYLTIVHWSSYFCFIFLAIFFNSLQQHVANIWPLYCPLLYEIFAHAIIVQTLHSESTCVCQYWLLFVAFFAFN
ncbi:uncharacterized protein [Lolium perenne]|uniref:uncharacterized protein n=1 Tax=Lolium perenne TaxID=4522 RepID=UPI003A99026A